MNMHHYKEPLFYIYMSGGKPVVVRVWDLDGLFCLKDYENSDCLSSMEGNRIVGWHSNDNKVHIVLPRVGELKEGE